MSSSSVPKKQRRWYSRKTQRHTVKIQVTLDSTTGLLLTTYSAPGAIHDFQVFKHSQKRWRYRPYFIADKGYQGLESLAFKAVTPFKQTKQRPLTPEQRDFNREVSRRRIHIEHAFARLKTFNILGTRYRNRRRRLLLRFNLIAALYNFELINK